MESLLEQLKQLEAETAPLFAPRQQRIDWLEAVGDFANQYIDNLSDKLAFTSQKPSGSLLKINGKQKQMDQILTVFEQEVCEPGLCAASGGHLGYIPGGGIFTAALGDFLAAVSNEYAGVSYASPGAVAVENEVIDWLKLIFDFPTTAVGNLTSGGSMANLIALTAARDKYQVKNERITKNVIYLSPQAHHCITKSLRIIGLEDVQIRLLELDDAFRICPQQLENQIKKDIKEGLFPFLVIASAGTTDVGVVDPLDKIGKIAHQFQLWMHVDAAYGGFFKLTTKSNLFIGIEKADSLVVDPHKGMFLPYGVGAVLVKDAQTVLHSHHYNANYMQDAKGEKPYYDPSDLSPELTKHFRGMRIWLPLQLHGVAPFVAALEEKLLLTKYLRKCLVDIGFSVGPEPDLSVSYFWYDSHPNGNVFNKKLMELMHQDGRVFFSSTRLKGMFVIRIAILSFRTKKETIDKSITMIKECLLQTKIYFQSDNKRVKNR